MLWELLFLTVVGILLPFLAWSSHRYLTRDPAAEQAFPSSLALQTIGMQAVVMALAWLALAHSELTLSWSSDLDVLALLAAIGVVLVSMGVARLEARRPLGQGDALRRKLRSAGTTQLWLIAMIVAAIGEEFAYRGVLSLLVGQALTPMLGVLVSALLFGLAHFGQGWRGVTMSVVFGLGMQAVVYLSGGLSLAMLAHFLYDLGAAWLGGRLVQKEGREATAQS